MRKLIYGMNLTLDGYVAAPGDDLGWSGPSDVAQLVQRAGGAPAGGLARRTSSLAACACCKRDDDARAGV